MLALKERTDERKHACMEVKVKGRGEGRGKIRYLMLRLITTRRLFGLRVGNGGDRREGGKGLMLGVFKPFWHGLYIRVGQVSVGSEEIEVDVETHHPEHRIDVAYVSVHLNVRRMLPIRDRRKRVTRMPSYAVPTCNGVTHGMAIRRSRTAKARR